MVSNNEKNKQNKEGRTIKKKMNLLWSDIQEEEEEVGKLPGQVTSEEPQLAPQRELLEWTKVLTKDAKKKNRKQAQATQAVQPAPKVKSLHRSKSKLWAVKTPQSKGALPSDPATLDGPNCYCGLASKRDKVKKEGKREAVGTEFVSCANGVCKFWWVLPMPPDLPTGTCNCQKEAAVCKVKNPESSLFQKMILSCATSKCKFYKVV